MPVAPTKNFLRTRPGDETPIPYNLHSSAPITEQPTDLLPKSWYVIIGGPFDGVRFGNYDREIRQDVERYANYRAYGPSAGVVNEATATKKLRETREQ
eukprot:5718165-Pleurochrysis_carterae.AAC.1